MRFARSLICDLADGLRCSPDGLDLTGEQAPLTSILTTRTTRVLRNLQAVPVMLRDVIESDLPIFFEHQRDPVATKMAAFQSRDHAAFMTHWRDRVLGIATNRAKTIEVDGRVAGNVGSWEQDGRRLVGYWIGREHWGRGIATRALTEFLAHDLERPLHAWVAVDNPASIRVLEKCGFRRDAATPPHTDEDGIVELLMTLAGADEP